MIIIAWVHTLGSVTMHIKFVSFLRLIINSCIAEFDLFKLICTTFSFLFLAYRLEDDDGKTYYKGRHFLRPVHEPDRSAKVNRCYSSSADNTSSAMDKTNTPRYSAILCNKTKKLHITTNEETNLPISHRPAPQRRQQDEEALQYSWESTNQLDREQLLPLHDKELRNQHHALVLDGGNLRPPAIRLVEDQTTPNLPGTEQKGENKNSK